MMRLYVQYSAQLRTAIGRAEETVDLPEGSSVHSLLQHIGNNRGEHVALHLFNRAGEAQPSLMVALNGSAIPPIAARSTALKAGDTIALMPPIAGG